MGSAPTGPLDPGAGEGTPMPPSYAPRSSGRRNSSPPPGRTRSGARPDRGGAGAPEDAPDSPARDSTPPTPPSGSDAVPHPPGSRARRIRASVAVGVVTLASGLLFSLSALTARQSAVPQDLGLVGLVRHQQDTVDQMMSGNQQLQGEIDTLVANSAASPAPSPTSVLQLSSVAVSGPGLTVTLTDAPTGPLPDGARPDDLVVHQQDIEDVMNALWKGGAEAMTVQGARVNARTVIRCIGNVILVDGARFSPPYVVSAIGDTRALQESLSTDERIQIYKGYVARYQLGWDVDVEDELDFPAVTQVPAVKFAQVEDHG